MELKERCDVATGAGSALGGLDPALLVPRVARAEGPPAPATAPYPVPRPVEVTGAEIRKYEDLDGADGRGVFFRPHRFGASDLVPLRSTVGVVLDGKTLPCPLHDVSQNGVAFVWPGADTPTLGTVIRVEVRFDDRSAWRGAVRVGSIRKQQDALLVGASFEGALLDTDALLQLRDVRRWSMPGGDAELASPRWRVAGMHRYKALVSELRLLLEDAEASLRAFETALPWHVMQERSSLAHPALVTRLHEDFGRHVLRIGSEIDAAWREGEGAEAERLKAFSVRHLHHFLMQAPWMHRARHKPFGYPGDYEVMNYVYEKDFEGPTLFARAIGHAFLQTPPAQAVCRRKDLMKEQLLAALQLRAGTDRPLRVLSIAAGPAREVQDLLTELDELPAPLEVVLFDQDKGALAHAHRRLWPLIESRFPGQVRLVLLNESIKRLLRDARLFEPFGGFDLIYSVGLFDYLQRATAVGLARNLFAAAAPGGQVLIANMVDHPGRWFMEQHLEWDLIYRTRKEMMEIAARAAPSARIRILEEATGVNPFVELVRT